ncbi:hypothetical protein CYL18_12060 [Pradoshia eiseniae]|uniref:Uncharacterized protein n=1 Tax=Pradoshia eiseniae TaxID=2064768 RepID=A0A2S7MZ37_9BACI|nr:hypothetical protein CYL18_12060 [Pradoshia eiseniae]
MWAKGGRSQANPTLAPGKGYEGWVKCGRKVGEARHHPPLPQAKGMKGGSSVVERWEKSGITHPCPRQRV